MIYVASLKPTKFLCFLFMLFSFPIASHSQTQIDKAVKYAHDDFLNTVKKEKPFGVSQVSSIKPVTLMGNLTNGDRNDLVVAFDSHSNKVGIAIVYIFRFDKEKIHLIYEKRAFRISAHFVTWKKYQALLITLGSFDDGGMDEIANLLVYKNDNFVNALEFPYATFSPAGYWTDSQVISTDKDQIQVIEYENDLKYEEGKPTCTKATLQTYMWDDEKISFNKGETKPLTKVELDDILTNNKLSFPDGLRDVCDSYDSEPVTNLNKPKVPIYPEH